MTPYNLRIMLRLAARLGRIRDPCRGASRRQAPGTIDRRPDGWTLEGLWEGNSGRRSHRAFDTLRIELRRRTGQRWFGAEILDFRADSRARSWTRYRALRA